MRGGWLPVPPWPSLRVLAWLVGLSLVVGRMDARATVLADTCDWSVLESSDTLTISLQQTPVGTLREVLHVDSVRRLITDSTYMEISPPGNVLGMGSMVVVEVRRYAIHDGSLLSARQSLVSSAGGNTWELSREAQRWTLSVKAGGQVTARTVEGIGDNLRSSRALMRSIKASALQPGDVIADSAFDLTSGAVMGMVTTCLATPDSSNGWHWVLENSIQSIGWKERWEADTTGAKVAQDVAPVFTARRTDHSARAPVPGGDGSARIVDFFDLCKVPARRVARSGEAISIAVDTPSVLHASVRSLYTRERGRWQLQPQARVCRVPMLQAVPDSLLRWVRPTVTIQSAHPDISKLARELSGNQSDACRVIREMNRYVFATLVKRNTATFSSALETLHAGFGDCGEHAVLLAALLRASGIPARVVYGLVYMPERKAYLYHAWVMAYAGGWIFADPALGVFPAARDRIPLMIDDTGEQLTALAGLVSRVHVEYVTVRR